jgi:hypothetical protein
MVRAQDVGQDGRRLDPAFEVVGNEEVVDAPADIARPRPALHVPPGIVPRLGDKDPEGVVIAVGDELGDPLTLDGPEARRVLVFLGPGDVDLRMRRVDIAARDDTLAGFPQSLREIEELVVELELVGEPLGSSG